MDYLIELYNYLPLISMFTFHALLTALIREVITGIYDRVIEVKINE